MSGGLKKRSFRLQGHATSVALEPEFWAALEKLVGDESLAALVQRVDLARGERGLASALRLEVLRRLG